jgi:hypothetical protein
MRASIVITAAVLAALALAPVSALATTTIEVGDNGTSIVVDGTTISTSNVTLAQLAELRGVPPETVKVALGGTAVNTPAAAAVEALVAALGLESTLSSALDAISKQTGGAVSPPAALRQTIQRLGQPGRTGANGAAGSGGAAGPTGAAGGAGGNSGSAGAGAGKAKANKRLTLRAAKRSLRGRPGSRVRVRFTVSSAAMLVYGGSKLAGGLRTVKAGKNVLSLKLPVKRGGYKLVLTALSTPDGQRARTTIVLHAAGPRKGR